MEHNWLKMDLDEVSLEIIKVAAQAGDPTLNNLLGDLKKIAGIHAITKNREDIHGNITKSSLSHSKTTAITKSHLFGTDNRKKDRFSDKSAASKPRKAALRRSKRNREALSATKPSRAGKPSVKSL